MTATNHTLTGAVIGAAIPNPIIAIPLAFLSHFVLDAIPHFDGKIDHGSTKFMYYLAIDCGLALALLITIFGLRLDNWPLLIACGVAGASPDLMWFSRWWNETRGKDNKPMGKFRKFHAKIQWSETQQGILLEIPWFFTGLYLLAALSV